MLVLPHPFDWADGHKFVYDPAKKHRNLGALPYQMTLGPGTLIESDGAPFVAYVPAFGNHSIRAYGDTPQEALDDLEAMVPGMLAWWQEEYGALPGSDDAQL